MFPGRLMATVSCDTGCAPCSTPRHAICNPLSKTISNVTPSKYKQKKLRKVRTHSIIVQMFVYCTNTNIRTCRYAKKYTARNPPNPKKQKYNTYMRKIPLKRTTQMRCRLCAGEECEYIYIM